MACGCKGGTWTPPDAKEAPKPGQQKLPPATTQGAVGPAAPGYFHGPDR